MGRKNQRRGKQQEYRLISALKGMDVEIIKYYGQRDSKAGDVLAKVGKCQVRFDHKSASSNVVIRLQRKWMEKIVGESMNRMDAEGMSIPAVSFSIYNKSELYVMCGLPLRDDYGRYFTINTKFKTNESLN